jgi:hypothetical protein
MAEIGFLRPAPPLPLDASEPRSAGATATSVAVYWSRVNPSALPASLPMPWWMTKRPSGS